MMIHVHDDDSTGYKNSTAVITVQHESDIRDNSAYTSKINQFYNKISITKTNHINNRHFDQIKSCME